MSEVKVEIVGENQVPSGPSEPGGIDFGALKAQAMKMADEADAARNEPDEPVDPAKPAVDPTQVRVKGATQQAAKSVEPVKPVVEAPKEVAASEEAAADVFEIPDDKLVKTIVDGEEVILPWKEAKNKISGGLKFTKNMQDLAKQRTEFANEQAQTKSLRDEHNQLLGLLQNEQAVASFIRNRYPKLIAAEQQAAPVGADPGEIATVEQAAAIARQEREALETSLNQSIEQRLVAVQREIEDRQQIAKHQVAINATLADIFAKNPVLKNIPDVEDVIRYNVAKMITPKSTEEEALEAFRTVAGGMVEGIDKHFKAQNKIKLVQKEKLETKSIEPAGGAAPQPQPTNYKNPDGSVNWNKVRQMADDYSG